MIKIKRRPNLDPSPLERVVDDPILRQILVNRGITSESELNGSINCLLRPELKDIEYAAQLIAMAICQRQKILIAGDYDVDGMTGTALGVRCLEAFGMPSELISYYVPSRYDHGYGLNTRIVAQAYEDGVSLIVTVDNGIAAFEAVKAAKERGIKVVITDHHEVQDNKLPEADAVVDPKRADDNFASKNLCGCGVLFYVLCVVRSVLVDMGYFPRRDLAPVMTQFLDLVSISTIGDVMTLDANNRRLVRAGLKRIHEGNASMGIKALLQHLKINPEKLTTRNLAFDLCPRFNAATRIKLDSNPAIDLLLCKQPEQALKLAYQLDMCNRRRMDHEKIMTARAHELYLAQVTARSRALLNAPQDKVAAMSAKVQDSTASITDSAPSSVIAKPVDTATSEAADSASSKSTNAMPSSIVAEESSTDKADSSLEPALNADGKEITRNLAPVAAFAKNQEQAPDLWSFRGVRCLIPPITVFLNVAEQYQEQLKAQTGKDNPTLAASIAASDAALERIAASFKNKANAKSAKTETTTTSTSTATETATTAPEAAISASVDTPASSANENAVSANLDAAASATTTTSASTTSSSAAATAADAAVAAAEHRVQRSADAVLNVVPLSEAKQSSDPKVEEELSKIIENNEQDAGIVLFDPCFMSGIVGLVATRTRERLGRPCMIFGADVGVGSSGGIEVMLGIQNAAEAHKKLEQEGSNELMRYRDYPEALASKLTELSGDTPITGSARSVPGVDLMEVFAYIKSQEPNIFLAGGGHRAAAGATICLKDLERFRELFAEGCRRSKSQAQETNAHITDGELPDSHLCLAFASDIESLGPWGKNYEEPVFDGIFYLDQVSVINKRHLKMRLRTEHNHYIEAIKFRANLQEKSLVKDLRVQVLYKLSIDRYLGREFVQLMVESIEPV